MEQRFCVKESPYALSLTDHGGTLTKADVKDNLRKAINLSNEYGEDWIADLKMYWENRAGMIPETDEEVLEDEEVIENWVDTLTNVWEERGDQAQFLLNKAGVGDPLEPLDEEEEEYVEDEKDYWTLNYILTVVLEMEAGPY